MERVEQALMGTPEGKGHTEEVQQLLKELQYVGSAAASPEKDPALAPPAAILEHILLPLANGLLDAKARLHARQKKEKALQERLAAVQRERDAQAETNEKLVSEMEQISQQAGEIKSTLERLQLEKQHQEDKMKALMASEETLLDVCLKQGPLGVLQWCQERLQERNESLPQPLADLLTLKETEKLKPLAPLGESALAVSEGTNEEAILFAWAPLGLGLGIGFHRGPENYPPSEEGRGEEAGSGTAWVSGQEGEEQVAEQGGRKEGSPPRDSEASTPGSQKVSQHEPNRNVLPSVGEITEAEPVDMPDERVESAAGEMTGGNVDEPGHSGKPTILRAGVEILAEEIRSSVAIVMGAAQSPALAVAIPFAIARFYCRVAWRLLASGAEMALRTVGTVLAPLHKPQASQQ